MKNPAIVHVGEGEWFANRHHAGQPFQVIGEFRDTHQGIGIRGVADIDDCDQFIESSFAEGGFEPPSLVQLCVVAREHRPERHVDGQTE